MQIADDAVLSSRPERNGLVARLVLGLALAVAIAVAAYPLVGAGVLGQPGATRSVAMAAPVVQSIAGGASDSSTASASLPAPDASTEASGAALGGLVALPGSAGGASGDARSADQPAPSPTALAGAPSSPIAAAPTTSNSDTCNVRPTTSADGFDPYYTQICVVGGIPMLGSADVDSRALVAAARIVTAMLAPRPDLRAQLVAHRMRVGVLGLGHKAIDLPEYRDLPVKYPATDWNAARAYSATPARPLMTSPEENLVCSPADTYPGQQVMVHEMGHSVMDLAVRYIDSGFWDRVQQAYDQSMAAGRWVGYYGGSSATEYWAEGVQAYFNASRATPGPDPLGTPVDTREGLTAYDPALAGLIREVFTDSPWRASCP